MNDVSTQRATIEVPNNVNQAQVLVTRMFEGLQADVARNHEFVATMVASLENRIMEQQRYGEQLARIEAQLAALRADADKGRAASEKEAQGRYERLLTLISVLQDSTFKRLEGIELQLETLGLQQDVIEKKLDEQFVPSETFDEWWQCVGHTHMPKHDQPPEHASIAETAWNAALRSVANRPVTHKRNLHLRPVSRKKRKR